MAAVSGGCWGVCVWCSFLGSVLCSGVSYGFMFPCRCSWCSRPSVACVASLGFSRGSGLVAVSAGWWGCGGRGSDPLWPWRWAYRSVGVLRLLLGFGGPGLGCLGWWWGIRPMSVESRGLWAVVGLVPVGGRTSDPLWFVCGFERMNAVLCTLVCGGRGFDPCTLPRVAGQPVAGVGAAGFRAAGPCSRGSGGA